MTPLASRALGPVSDKALKPLPYLARNWQFESTPLQGRVRKLSVPEQRTWPSDDACGTGKHYFTRLARYMDRGRAVRISEPLGI
jgi:hypothetical protein